MSIDRYDIDGPQGDRCIEASFVLRRNAGFYLQHPWFRSGKRAHSMRLYASKPQDDDYGTGRETDEDDQ
jgi:hypothetical protein